MGLTKTHTLLGAAGAALLLIGSVSAGASNDDGRPPSVGDVQVTSVEQEAKEAMSVFAELRTAEDAMREDVAQGIDSHPSFGMNPGLSRLAIGNATLAVHVVPARGHVCAVLSDPKGATTTCPPTADVVRGDAGPATVAFDEGTGLFGLVPNGVESVSVPAGTGTVEVTVHRNAYFTVIPKGTSLRTISYVGPNGRVEFEIHDPSLAWEG